MNLHAIDWVIVFGLLALLLGGAVSTRRYTRTVTAFLAAERCGGRYLLSVAQGAAMLGVITVVTQVEQNYKVGYTPYWWGLMEGPALIAMAMSGWVIYRFRQTRAMTLAQFFEIRYSRNFRVFAGVVAFLAGIVNFGIFPAVGARFFIAIGGWPESLAIAGQTIPTFPLVMAVLLSISLIFVFLGGQIAVMVTDFIQGTFAGLVFIAALGFLLMTFSWDQISTVLLQAPEEQSLVNPFALGEEDHFNFWYYAIGVVIFFYGAMSWQGTSGYQCAAINAHEAKMAGILGMWRHRVLWLIVLILPICVRTFLSHPDYAEPAAAVHAQLATLESDTLVHQLRTPFAIGAIFPRGLLGLIAASMLALFISTHDTYLHSWGSILVQDVILPFRRTPFTARQHLILLRLAILVVAIFIFVFSILYEPTQYVAMFTVLAAAIFIGGAGSAVIGGLYWKRGTTAGAWTAMITGMTLSGVGIIVKQIDPSVFEGVAPDAMFAPAAEFLLYIRQNVTGQVLTFYAIICSVIAYVAVSLLGPRRTFNMDRMLHRGPYALAGENTTTFADARTWMERLGFSRDFTGRDKIVAFVTVSWPLAWTVIFVAGTWYGLRSRRPGDGDATDRTWVAFWEIYTWVILACSIVVTIWFTIGGSMDLVAMYRRLRRQHGSDREDGRVIDHHNVGEGDDSQP